MNASTRPMAPTQNDPVTARRALAHALAGYLDDARVRDAVSLWNQHFEGRGSLFLGLSRYCKQLAERFELPGKEAELHLKIFRALQLDPRLLPADPLAVPAAAAAALGVPVAAPTPGQSARVLQQFYLALETQLARDPVPGLTPARLRRQLIAQTVTLSRPAQQAASLWWSGQGSALGGDWPAGGAGTALANAIYVAFAELLGPVRADRCFTQAVAQLEASGDAELAEIRRYL